MDGHCLETLTIAVNETVKARALIVAHLNGGVMPVVTE